jgi:hypothetical protein
VTKLMAYRSLPSLRAYLVVDPVTSTIQAHVRSPSGRWSTTSCGLGDMLLLPCPDYYLNVDDVFL